MKARRHCYLVADGTGWAAFVPVPGGVGYYKTAWCVVLTTCAYCGAKPGVLCEGTRGPTASAHWQRRTDAMKLKDKPGVRDRLLRAVPAVTLALDTLAEAFK
jgi:hypothetical protein